MAVQIDKVQIDELVNHLNYIRKEEKSKHFWKKFVKQIHEL